MKWPNKDPQDVLDYAIDWSAELEEETLTGSAWSVAPNTLTIDSDAIGGDQTILWLSGGESGTRYTVTNTVTTSAGRTFRRSVHLTVVER